MQQMDKISSNIKLIRSAFVKMMIVNMFVMMASCMCSFIDNIVIGRLLGTEALAAVGFFSPLATAVALYNMLVIGVQVLCGNYIGEGKRDQLDSLFVNVFVFLAFTAAGVSVLAIVFREGLATLLGARGFVHTMLCGYIAGYMPGVPAQALSAMLMALVTYNNDIRRSYFSAAVMAAGNAAGDILLAGTGTFGIGLASTISSILSLCILLPGYCRKDKTLHFKRVPPDWKAIGQAARRGIPFLTFTGGLLVKNSLLNYTLSTWEGTAGVAVANVLASCCNIFGIFTGGFGTAYLALSSLYFGEKDRTSFSGLFRIAIRIGETCIIVIVAAAIACAPFLSDLFFPAGTPEWEMGRQMFKLGFLFFPFNILLIAQMNSLRAQGRMMLVNIMSAAEVSLVGLTIAFTVPLFGSNAAWLANMWVDLLCILVMLGYSWFTLKRVDLNADTIISLPDNFGASPDEFREYSLKTMEDVSPVSESVITFCSERGINKKPAMYAGVCVEEMAKNIFSHGSRPGKNTYVDVRIVVKDDLTIRIRDNCPEFDPRKRLELYQSRSPEQNFGIRLTAKLAHQIDYYNNAGINTLIMWI